MNVHGLLQFTEITPTVGECNRRMASVSIGKKRYYMFMQYAQPQHEKPGWTEFNRIDHDCPLVVTQFHYIHF